MATTAIDWLMSPAVHSAGLVMWDIGFLLATLAPSQWALAVVSQVPGRHVRLPSIWFWMTLKDRRWREAGMTVTKHLKSLKCVLVLWKPGVKGVKMSMRPSSIIKSSQSPTCRQTPDNCDFPCWPPFSLKLLIWFLKYLHINYFLFCYLCLMNSHRCILQDSCSL